MSDQGIVTYAGIAHPWMCDTMGHLNVRHYVAMFDDASYQLLGRVAGPAADPTRQGWADVKMEIEYLHETLAGTLITIHSQVERIGTTSLVYTHVLSGTIDSRLRARMRTTTVAFDLTARAKTALDAGMRERAAALMLQAAGA